MSKLWQKSSTDTESETAKQVEAFTVGNDYELDQVLVPYDLKASAVHAKALEKAGILSSDERQKLTGALSDIQQTWEKGEFEIIVSDEDMHTAIENCLVDKLGDLGKKIHTGRSRNDQVLTAMRLFEKDRLKKILEELKSMAQSLIAFGEHHQTVPMPGFTHTRKAMLSSVGLWAGGFAELLIMQMEASSGIKTLVDRSPLGTAAGFGTTFDIDREFEAEELGFSAPLICSTSAQLSRGWVELQFVQYLAGVTSVLNRLASDVIQFSSEAYPWFDLDAVVCTGSSIMPQKKNPDVAELIRGKHATLIGSATTLQTVIANLGSGYHRDLQLTKEPVLNAVRQTLDILKASQILIDHINVNEKEMRAACTKELFAAEVANKLVREKNLSFREAYKRAASSPELTDSLSINDIMKTYTHIGSPGNPGIERLKKLSEI